MASQVGDHGTQPLADRARHDIPDGLDRDMQPAIGAPRHLQHPDTVQSHHGSGQRLRSNLPGGLLHIQVVEQPGTVVEGPDQTADNPGSAGLRCPSKVTCRLVPTARAV